MNKPQLALAWLGEEKLLSEAWAQMKKTPIAGELPIEIMPRPQSVSVETETWRYRFYHCPTAEELAYMRVSTNRPAGVLWCFSLGLGPALLYSEALFFAGSLGLPVVVFLFGAARGTTEAEEGERALRELLSELGFLADEALIVYGLPSLESPSLLQWSSAITGLYRSLDSGLSIPAEQKLPPRFFRCTRAEIVLFFTNEIAKTAFRKGAKLELLLKPKEVAIASIIEVSARRSIPRGACLKLSLDFGMEQDLGVEGSFVVATEATLDQPAANRWGLPNPERYTGYGFAIRDLP